MKSFFFKSQFIISLAILTCYLLAACTVGVPSNVIQPQKMENLLYDYHLMQSMANELTSSEQYKRKQYEQYVFDKHRVSEAQFDSSLVWYMRHTRELEIIYKNLTKRYTDQKEALANHIPPYEREKTISPVGDTVNVWNDFRLMRLTTSPIANKLTFEMKADSNFHKRDSIVWKMNFRFLGDTARAHAVMGLTMICNQDTIGQSINITHSGTHSLSLVCDSDYTLKNIYGHVYYYLRHQDLSMDDINYPDDKVLPVGDLLLSDIEFMRYHRKEIVSTDTATIANDSLIVK